MKMRKNILLADCKAEEVIPFAEELFWRGCSFEIREHIANWKRTGKVSELKRYARYFGVAFHYFLRRNKIDAVVGWQQFYALIYCFYCSVFSVKKANTVVALNFTYKEKRGRMAKLYRWFMGKCLSNRYLDYIHVPSRDYAEAVHNEFSFPKEQIIVSNFGVNDQYSKMKDLEAPHGFRKDGYALSIGRSNRDFDFLIRAWSGIDFPLVIISDTYKGRAKENNITILTDVAGEASYPWISNCGLMVIPIDDGTICSGDTVLLTAMSLQRKIIVTEPSTLAEMYIEDGKNAILAPKREDVFRRKVQEVLFSEKYKELGECARTSFLQNYTTKSMGKRVTEILKKTEFY